MNQPSTAPTTLSFDDTPVSASPISAPAGGVSLQFDEVVTEVSFAPMEVASFVSEPRPVPAESKTHLIASDGWSWEQLRDYVVSAITATRGSQPRNPMKEKAIFSAFIGRWGDRAEAIARQAVEVHQCWWKSAPLSVERFCLGSDPYFAEVIAASL